MKPLSTHWADTSAVRMIKERGAKEQYVVASGITPSGLVHIGNFREVLTVDLVARALRKLGVKVRFIYSWDDFDTFRKVPKNLPDPEAFVPYLRRPIARIPDPWGNASSYARGREELFENELKSVGIYPDYIYQEQQYSKGVYATQIRTALEKAGAIRGVLDKHRSTPLPEEWLPTSIYCESCERDEMTYERYPGGWEYVYKCASCGHEATTDIRTTGNLKLGWRSDWPMRWHFEQVDFEPGGKDHSSDGGSYDTGKEIIAAVWGDKAPSYLQYDFVMIKGGTGKMSSSSGELFTLGDVLEVYDPQIVRWIFANQRPNTDFSLAFDEDVFKTHDEFDRSELQAWQTIQAEAQGTPDSAVKAQLNRRVYELALVDESTAQLPPPYRAPFRELCSRLQICDGDGERTLTRFYREQVRSERDAVAFRNRVACAWRWLNKRAPEEFCYRLHAAKIEQELTTEQAGCLAALRQIVATTDLEQITTQALNQLIYDQAVHGASCEPKAAFVAIYRQLIGRDQGPRLPGFLKEIGRERLLALL